MRLFHVYRPRLPEVRAQTLQVVHTCHALATAGVSVSLWADADPAVGPPISPRSGLAAYGLDLPPTFDLRVAPTAWPPGAGWWYRASLRRWRGDVVYLRDRRYLRWVPPGPKLVWEAHEVDSVLAEERGEDPEPVRRAERALLARCAGVVTNCAGTLDLLRSVHRVDLPARIIHNATRADRAVARAPRPAPVVGYAGSVKDYKGLATVLASVPAWPPGVTLEIVGGVVEGAPAGVTSLPAVPYGDLPARLAGYHALLLPLADNVYGRSLVNPLKLWDYLATGIPIVAADLPGVREVAGDHPCYYPPGDAAGLADAVRRALVRGASPPRLRTWDERAREILAFLATL